MTIAVIPIWQPSWSETRSKEILRNPISVNQIPVLLVQMVEPTSGYARTDYQIRHAWEEPRASKNSPWCPELQSAPSLIFPRIKRRSRKASARARCFFHGCSTGVCLRWTCHDLRPSQPRTLLKLIWDPERRVAIHKPVYNVTFWEHKRGTVVASQQRMRNRHQARRGPQDCKNRAPHVKERYNCSTSGETDASGDDYLLRSTRRRFVRRPSSLGRMKN